MGYVKNLCVDRHCYVEVPVEGIQSSRLLFYSLMEFQRNVCCANNLVLYVSNNTRVCVSLLQDDVTRFIGINRANEYTPSFI